nr:unnamed protein product [Callosobruchus analis]
MLRYKSRRRQQAYAELNEPSNEKTNPVPYNFLIIEPSLWYFNLIEYVFNDNKPRLAVDSLQDITHQECNEVQNMGLLYRIQIDSD